MRASSMFLRPLFLARFSSSFAALKVDASIISRKTLSTPSSLLRTFTPLLTPQEGSYIPYVNISHQFRQRSPRRLYASSSEPPLLLLHPKVVPKEQGSKDDCATESTTTVSKPFNLETETSTGKSAIDAAIEEFKRASSVASNGMAFKNVDPSSPGRQRKRKAFVAQAPKRLYSEEEDLGYMQEALAEAKKAAKKAAKSQLAPFSCTRRISLPDFTTMDESRVETTNDPTAHAEMLFIRSAAAQLGGWRLTDVAMYVTLEPCPMCAGAILQGRVSELVWGAPNSLLGADGS